MADINMGTLFYNTELRGKDKVMREAEQLGRAVRGTTGGSVGGGAARHGGAQDVRYGPMSVGTNYGPMASRGSYIRSRADMWAGIFAEGSAPNIIRGERIRGRAEQWASHLAGAEASRGARILERAQQHAAQQAYSAEFGPSAIRDYGMGLPSSRTNTAFGRRGPSSPSMRTRIAGGLQNGYHALGNMNIALMGVMFPAWEMSQVRSAMQRGVREGGYASNIADFMNIRTSALEQSKAGPILGMFTEFTNLVDLPFAGLNAGRRLSRMRNDTDAVAFRRKTIYAQQDLYQQIAADEAFRGANGDFAKQVSASRSKYEAEVSTFQRQAAELGALIPLMPHGAGKAANEMTLRDIYEKILPNASRNQAAEEADILRKQAAMRSSIKATERETAGDWLGAAHASAFAAFPGNDPDSARGRAAIVGSAQEQYRRASQAERLAMVAQRESAARAGHGMQTRMNVMSALMRNDALGAQLAGIQGDMASNYVATGAGVNPASVMAIQVGIAEKQLAIKQNNDEQTLRLMSLRGDTRTFNLIAQGRSGEATSSSAMSATLQAYFASRDGGRVKNAILERGIAEQGALRSQFLDTLRPQEVSINRVDLSGGQSGNEILAVLKSIDEAIKKLNFVSTVF